MNSDVDDILGRLEAESSISSIVRSYEAVLERPLKNKFYAWAAFLVASAASLLFWCFGNQFEHVDATLVNLVGLALSFSGVALGLGLAGLAIYSSSLKPEILLAMVKADYPGSRQSLLKTILASFVYAIVSFIKLFAVCGTYYVFVSSNSFVSDLITSLFSDVPRAELFFSLCFFPIFMYQIVFAFSTLWSFIFNLHLTFITVAAAEIVLLKKRETQAKVI
jgi:hypothetical protein